MCYEFVSLCVYLYLGFQYYSFNVCLFLYVIVFVCLFISTQSSHVRLPSTRSHGLLNCSNPGPGHCFLSSLQSRLHLTVLHISFHRVPESPSFGGCGWGDPERISLREVVVVVVVVVVVLLLLSLL